MRLVMVILVLALPPIQSVKPIPQKSGPDTKQTKAADEVRDSPDTGAINSAKKKPAPDYKCQDGQNNATEPAYKVDVTSFPIQPRDPLYFLYIVLTAVSAMAAIGALIAVEVQIRTLRSSERAWIMITPVKPQKGEVFPDIAVEFKGAVRNLGKTPARIRETEIQYKTVSDLLELSKAPQYKARSQRNEMIIVPTDSFPLDVDTRSLGKIQYVYGIVVYRDVYGKRRETQFGFVYNRKMGWEIGGPEKYNRAT
jgi:hypothetical protein